MAPGPKKFSLLLCFTSLLFPAGCPAWQGKVVGVSDGDTITVMHDGKGEKIRIYGVDCPEGHQDFGSKAKQFTSDMVFGKMVDVKRMDSDRYGRTVGVVTVAGKSINEELLKSGMAWFFTKYCKESFCEQWKQSEERARKGKVGLWSMPSPIPPWEFRHGTSR
jgi:micrococcal nuclease